MTPARPSGTRTLTARLPEPEYEALRAYAFFTSRSMNELVVEAIRTFLTEHGGKQDIDPMVDEARRRFRETLERLKRED